MPAMLARFAGTLLVACGAAVVLAGCFEPAAPTTPKTLFRVGEVFARTVSKADIRRAHATAPQCKSCPAAAPGRWTAEVTGSGVVLKGPEGEGGISPLTKLGAVYVAPAGAALCRDSQGRAVGGRGRYRLRRASRVVTITRISDRCHARAAVIPGEWRKVGGRFASS